MKTIVAVVAALLLVISFGKSEGTETVQFRCATKQSAEYQLLREEAVKSARETGVGEDEMYRVFVFSYLGLEAEKAARSENPVEAEHGKLRAAVYNGATDASLKIALSLKEAKQLVADLQKEEAATDGQIVSPELARRLNKLGALGMATIHAVTSMSAARVNLASYEAGVGCNSRQGGYIVKCLESLHKAVDDISAAMDMLKTGLEPLVGVSLLSMGRQFKY